MKRRRKLLISGVVLSVATALTCAWPRVSAARVVNTEGFRLRYRVYRSVWGNVYLEDLRNGLPLIIYPRRRVVTYPNAGDRIAHTPSWVLLDPMRSLVPVDKPLTL